MALSRGETHDPVSFLIKFHQTISCFNVVLLMNGCLLWWIMIIRHKIWVSTYTYLDENQYVTYLIHWFSLRASCYRIPNLAAAQSHGNALQEGATVSPSSAFSLRKSMAWIRRLQACNHLVYLSAKFGVLNQRINEIRSSENQWWPLGPTPSVTDSQICKTTHSESLSGCVTWLQCFLWHHGPLWTTVYMPPLSCMQAAL